MFSNCPEGDVSARKRSHSMPTSNARPEKQQQAQDGPAVQPLITAGSVPEQQEPVEEGGISPKSSSPRPETGKQTSPTSRTLVHQPQSKESPPIFEKSKLKRLRHSAIRDDGYCSSSSTPLSSGKPIPSGFSKPCSLSRIRIEAALLGYSNMLLEGSVRTAGQISEQR